MSTQYNYTFANFNGNFSSDDFQTEISNSSIIPVCLYINTFGTNIEIWFASALSPVEESTLNTLVSNHNPDPSIFKKLTFNTITSSNSPYNVRSNSLLCDTTSGNIVLTLPNIARTQCAVFAFKKISASNTVTINPFGSELIDGLSVKTLSALNERFIIRNDGTNWVLYTNSIIDQNKNRCITVQKGSIPVDNGISQTELFVGSNGQTLTADSSTATGLKWSDSVVPGDPSRSIQFNNSGLFAGATGLAITNNTQNLIFNPVTGITGVSFEPLPTNNQLILYSENRASSNRLSVRSGTRDIYNLQISFAGPHISYFCAVPGNNSTVGTGSFLAAAVGTVATVNVATTDIYTSIPKVQVSTTAVIGNVARKSGPLAYFIGNSITSGYYFVCRFGLLASNTSTRFFCGMYPLATATSADPNTIVGRVGYGFDSTIDSNIVSYPTSATNTKVATSIPIPTTNTMYELRVYACKCITFKMGMSLEVIGGTGTLAQRFHEVNITDTSYQNVLLAPYIWIAPTIASARSFAINTMYIEKI